MHATLILKGLISIHYSFFLMCYYFAILIRMLISFFKDLDIQLISELKNSFEKIIQSFLKHLKKIFLDTLYSGGMTVPGVPLEGTSVDQE